MTKLGELIAPDRKYTTYTYEEDGRTLTTTPPSDKQYTHGLLVTYPDGRRVEAFSDKIDPAEAREELKRSAIRFFNDKKTEIVKLDRKHDPSPGGPDLGTGPAEQAHDSPGRVRK